MIRPLRRLHGAVILLLLLILPLLLWRALAARKAEALLPVLPPELAPTGRSTP